MKGHTKLAGLALAVLVVVTLPACGSSSGSSSGGSSGKQAVCDARANLQESMKALADPALLTGGKSGIQSAVKQVQQDLDALKSAAKDNNKPQIDDVKSSLDKVDTAVGNLGDGNLADNLQSLGNAISDLGSSIGSLASSLTTKCGS